MNQIPEEKFNKRRLISSYFSVVVSISLVLFLTGILGVLLVNSKKVADHFKEQIVMTRQRNWGGLYGIFGLQSAAQFNRRLL